jgi:hypothetical protein
MRKRLSLRRYAGVTMLVAAATVIVLAFAGGASAVVAGAGFTTNDPNVDGNGSCLNGPASATPKVNCNLYGSKSFVWINGGPTAGQNSLTDGTYFFAVLDPGGQKDPNDGTDGNLSDVLPTSNTPGGDAYTAREFTVAGGKVATYIGSGHSTDSFYSDPNGLFINLMPYDDTTNPGGVYILAICQLSTDQASEPVEGIVAPSDCKYDAFKAPASTCVESCDPTPFGTISGAKYYDANHNGQRDPGELGIANWPIDYHDGLSGSVLTDAAGEFSLTLAPDTYSFAEAAANSPWLQTGNTVDASSNSSLQTDKTYSFTLGATESVSGLLFGNVCAVGNTGGLTLGFWSNKNGQAILAAQSAWLGVINALNLVGLTSPKKTLPWIHPTFSQYADFRTWILNATATNASYMLSAQLAATALNVNYGAQSTSVLVKVVLETSPGVFTTTWKPLSQVISEATAFLGTAAHLNTTASGVDRDNALMYKDIFDGLNNNLLSVTPPAAGGCPAPTFPAS